MPDLASVGLGGVVCALLGGGGVWTWMSTRAKAPADMLASVAAFQTALNQAAAELTKSLEAKIKDLEARVAQLEDENDQCRGENRGFRQRIDSLEAFLRRQGIPVPQGGVEGALVIIEGDCATVVAPPAKAKGATP